MSGESYLDQRHQPSNNSPQNKSISSKALFQKLRLGLRTARPIENHCAYSSRRKYLQLRSPPKIIVIFNTKSINCCDNIIYRSGNTLRFPRVTREPPRTIVLWGLTLATIPAGVFVYFLRWICAFQLHHIYLSPD